MKKLCINLFGGPGIGKTTVAAELFVELKKNHIEAELVSEFAKDRILAGCSDSLKHQWYITGNQAYRIHIAYGHMQVTLTDSPILLAPIYDADSSPALLALSLEYHHKYDNFNIVLNRNSEFEHTMAGRVHSLTESVSIDNRIVRLLSDNDIPFLFYDDFGKDRIIQLILREIQ